MLFDTPLCRRILWNGHWREAEPNLVSFLSLGLNTRHRMFYIYSSRRYLAWCDGITSIMNYHIVIAFLFFSTANPAYFSQFSSRKELEHDPCYDQTGRELALWTVFLCYLGPVRCVPDFINAGKPWGTQECLFWMFQPLANQLFPPALAVKGNQKGEEEVSNVVTTNSNSGVIM